MSFIRRFIARFRCSDFAKNTAILSLGTAIAQLLAIVAMPALSRLYTPADFGLLAVFLAVTSIVATAVTLRYETSIMLPKDNSEAVNLVVLSFLSVITFGVIVGFSVWLMPEKLKLILGIAQLGDWLIIAIITGMLTALLAVGMAWFNRLSAYLKMAQLRVTQSVVWVLGAIVLGVYDLECGLILAQVIAFFSVGMIVISELSKINVHFSIKPLQQVAKNHYTAPKYLLPTALLDVVTLQIPVLLIATWFGNSEAGQFSMAWKILAVPAAIVGSAVGQVFMQRFTCVWPNVQLARSLLFKTWKMLALMGVFPTVLILILGEQLFTWVLGSNWLRAGEMATVIAPIAFIMLISSPTSGIYLVLGLQKYSLFFGLSFFFYRSACVYFGLVSNNILYGLWAWFLFELSAIVIYNLIALRRMRMQ